MGGDGPDALNFVGGDGHAEAGAADQDRPVRLAVRDFARRLHSDVRVHGVPVGGDADVGDRDDAGVRLEVGLDDLLVVEAGVIAADDEAEL